MGRDKALLPIGDKALLVHLAEMLRSIGEAFHVVAPEGRYESFGYPILPDLRPGCGPLAGIETALANSSKDWNLILACDLALMEPDWLNKLTEATELPNGLLCIASGINKNSPNPLCAVWHKDALPQVRSALDRGQLRVRSVLEEIPTEILIPPDPGILANWNRPEDVLK